MRRLEDPPFFEIESTTIDPGEPIDDSTIPATKTGTPITEYTIMCPTKIGILGPEGIFHQLRKDFKNFITAGVVRVCSEPEKGARGHTLSDMVVFQSYFDMRSRGKRTFLYFDFKRSRVVVDGYAFRVQNFRKPNKWTLFGSQNCEDWTPIHRHYSPIGPSTGTFAKYHFEQSDRYRYLMMKFYRKDLILERLDFFGILTPE